MKARDGYLRMHDLDNIVAAVTIAGFVLTIAIPYLPSAVSSYIAAAYAISEGVLLLVWMRRGGASSSLWNWLPPLWPCGRRIRSAMGRWILIVIFVGAIAAGLVGMLLGGWHK